jgi:hypothetical protein
MKQMSIIVKCWRFLQFLFKCTTICLNAFFQTKPTIIANVLQYVCIVNCCGFLKRRLIGAC